MHIYDITVTISRGMPVWPGDAPVTLEQVASLEAGDGYNLTRLGMGAHTGTHVDAPSHFLSGDALTVEKLPLKILSGRVYVLHIPDCSVITAEVLGNADIPPRTRRLLFKTGNSSYWATENAFRTDYVALSPDAARWLVHRGVKLVGIDYLSIAPFEDGQQTHEILLKAGVVIVEGLDLSQISQGRYTLHCLPLKIAGAEGAPARVILIGV